MEETLAVVERIIGEREGDGRTVLIALMQKIQGELGYIPPPAISRLAKALRVPESEIYGVATFYAQFRLTPQGRNVIKLCQGTACHVRGSSLILRTLEEHLGLRVGESTPDFEFSLEEIRCFGSCSLAPVMVVNHDTYGRLTPETARQIVERYRGNAKDS